MKSHIHYTGKPTKENLPKIVKQTRTFVLVSDANGNIMKYQRQHEVQQKPTRSASKKPKQSVSKATKMAKKMKPCVVNIENLSQHRMAVIRAELKRDHQLQTVKEKLKCLSCKCLFIIFM